MVKQNKNQKNNVNLLNGNNLKLLTFFEYLNNCNTIIKEVLGKEPEISFGTIKIRFKASSSSSSGLQIAKKMGFNVQGNELILDVKNINEFAELVKSLLLLKEECQFSMNVLNSPTKRNFAIKLKKKFPRSK